MLVCFAEDISALPGTKTGRAYIAQMNTLDTEVTPGLAFGEQITSETLAGENFDFIVLSNTVGVR